MLNELALVESRSLRAGCVDRVDVLDKVKALTLLPDDAHADIPIVADYYEVSTGTIESLVRRNRAELEENGMLTLKGPEFRDFATVVLKITNPMARQGTFFSRRAILNVGQLLEDSPIAKAVRAHLLDAEAGERFGRKASYIDAEVVTFDEAAAIYLQERGGDYPTPYFTTMLRAAGYLRQGGCVPRKKKRKFFFFNGGSWEIRTWALPLLFFEFEETMKELSPRPWKQLPLDEGFSLPRA